MSAWWDLGLIFFGALAVGSWVYEGWCIDERYARPLPPPYQDED
jgi:hypothetical protein